MDNITNAVGDMTSIVGSSWGQMGTNHFNRNDTNGDGIIGINDLTYVIATRNWGWSGTS